VWIGIESITDARSQPWLLSVDASSGDNPTVTRLSRAYHSFGLDDAERLWATGASGTALLTDDGQLVTNVENPWGTTAEASYYNSVAPAHAFGSLWAHEAAIPAVHRIDPVSGDVTATIDLSACEPGGGGHDGYHPALIYPIYDVDDLPDAIVASCPMDGATHAYNGSMTLIDPQTDTVLGVVDAGGNFGKGAVLDGKWYVPVVVGGDWPSQNGHGQIALIDPLELRPRVHFVSGPTYYPAALFAAGDSLWVLEHDTEPGERRVYRLLRLQAEDLT
jgi:hypothetical protein